MIKDFYNDLYRHKIDFSPMLVGNLNETQNKLNGDGI